MAIRILALVGDCYGQSGGIARYNQDLFEALADGGAEIAIQPRLGDTRGLALPAGISQFRPVFGRLGFAAVSLWHAWRRRPVDVVFCGHIYMAPIAWLVARLAGARCWMQVHGTEVWSGRRNIVRRAIEAADMVTAVSRGTRRNLLDWADICPELVRVLPDTVRDAFAPGPPSAALADRLKLGPGPILLTVGRLSTSERYKGHEAIFAALPALRARFADLVHVVAGDGDDRARLVRRARELAGDPAAVRFLGFVPEQDLPDLYRLADLYVMPSTQEGFGIVYLEAAACGLRVVGGIGGGSGDAIVDPRIGALVDPSDRGALIETIVRLLGQGKIDPVAIEPYRRKHFAEAARRLLTRLAGSPRHPEAVGAP
jgi:phosphatidyl-myo-inositol dimannoside synthase